MKIKNKRQVTMTKGDGSAGGQRRDEMIGDDQRRCRATAGNGGSLRDPDGNE